VPKEKTGSSTVCRQSSLERTDCASTSENC